MDSSLQFFSGLIRLNFMDLISVARKLKNTYNDKRNFIFFREDTSMVMVKFNHPISIAQVFPISNFSSNCIEFFNVKYFIECLKKIDNEIKLIFVQSSWDVPASELKLIFDSVRKYQKKAKLVFLDWYAPLHIPQPEVIDYVDLYVKKQTLKDISQYKHMYDTNLVEYESQWNKDFLNVPEIVIDVNKLEEKLYTGWNFATDEKRINQLRKRYYLNQDRPIDIHCRMCAPSNRDTWYNHMRGRAYDAIDSMSLDYENKFNVLNENTLIDYNQYIKEIYRSKLCVSPFGYGEVCWRDFEAILAGALLVKPDMSHIKTNPDIYIPYETYIPCSWDFSDLESQCVKYLNENAERERIRLNACKVWEDFLDFGWKENFNNIFKRLSLQSEDINAF